MSRINASTAPTASSSSSGQQKKRRSLSNDPRPGPSSKPSTRPSSSARTSPTTTTITGFAAPSRRPPSQPSKHTSIPTGQRSSAFTSQATTPSSSAASSRRSSVVDTSAYRYSLNVGSINRFPTTSGTAVTGGDLLRAAQSAGDAGVDPSRASIGSSTSSRLSSRYTAEEVAPQRRPVYLALPSDPGALGVWSSSTLAPPPGADANIQDAKGKPGKDPAKKGEGGRRNSKIMTSFPFPHPVTPRRRPPGTGADRGTHGKRGLNATWQRLLTAIFAGPYERQLNREEQQDDQITQSIIQDIARRNGGNCPLPTTTSYGTIPITKPSPHPDDPYGYRQLAGPHLLPSYTTDLVARRRERRRARSRARFQCMASWTIWTVSLLLVVIVIVLVLSFVFPDKLDIPNRSDDSEDVLAFVTSWLT